MISVNVFLPPSNASSGINCRIVVLDAGRVVEQGTHASLVAAGEPAESYEAGLAYLIEEAIHLVWGRAAVEFNPPPALDGPLFSALVEMGEALKTDSSVRAVVLSGEGRAFCAGLDMASFAAMKQDGDAVPGVQKTRPLKPSPTRRGR